MVLLQELTLIMISHLSRFRGTSHYSQFSVLYLLSFCKGQPPVSVIYKQASLHVGEALGGQDTPPLAGGVNRGVIVRMEEGRG